jgi:cell division protein ZapA
MDGEEKRPVRLTIYNQTFTLRVSGDPEQMQRAALEVDELMTAIARSGNMDSTRVAILACLHLQDRVDAMQQELEKLRAIEDRTRELAALLDVVAPEIEPRMNTNEHE